MGTINRKILYFYEMLTKRDYLSIIAFLLFILGFTSLTLSLVGIRISIISWVDDISPLVGFITKILMVVASIIILSIAQSSPERDIDS